MAEFADKYANYKKTVINLENSVEVKTTNKDGVVTSTDVYETITIRMPDAEDLEDVDIMSLRKIGAFYPVIARLSGWSLVAIRKLQLPDLLVVVAECKDFLPKSLRTWIASLPF